MSNTSLENTLGPVDIGAYRSERGFDDISHTHSSGEMENQIGASDDPRHEIDIENRALVEFDRSFEMGKVRRPTGREIVDDFHLMTFSE